MMNKVRKAVIPAAGLGTRVLPASKAMPKEMIPIVDKPAIQYIVQEAVASGITDILIILNRGKDLVEDHFDRVPELEAKLLGDPNKKNTYDEIVNISKLANIFFIRQKETKGLGHAISCARSFVSDEPFAVLYGDDVIINEQNPVCGQLISAYDKYGKGAVGVNYVSDEDLKKYSSLKLEKLCDNIYSCTDMIEKPKTKQEAFSNYSILGRCVLPAKIFDILDETKPGAGGEIQLTDAMKKLAKSEGMIAVDFDGVRYDMGNKLGILKANIELGLKHNEIGSELKEYIKQIASKV